MRSWIAKPPTRLTSARSDGAGRAHRAGDGVGVEEVGLDELQALVLLDALELALGDPGHDDAPAVVEEGAA